MHCDVVKHGKILSVIIESVSCPQNRLYICLYGMAQQLQSKYMYDKDVPC